MNGHELLNIDADRHNQAINRTTINGMINMHKILIDKTIDEEAARILSKCAEVEMLDTSKAGMDKISPSDIICIRTNTNVDQEFIDSAPNLKIIATATTGTNHIDTRYAERKGIRIIDAKGANADSVADYVFRILFHITDDAYYTNELLKGDPGKFLKLKKENSRRELASFSIGIIGLGNIGKRVALRAAAFGMDIKAYDPYVDIAKDSLHDVLGCDIVTIHAELTDETKGMLKYTELSRLKQGAILINAARAEIIEESAMMRLLDERQDIKVIADVFYDEPNPSKIYCTGNCTVTPHIAGNAIEAKRRAAVVIAERIKNAIREEICIKSYR